MFLVTGSILALAVYTRPVFLVAIFLFAVTILVSKQMGRTFNTRLRRLAVMLVGFAMISVPASLVFKNLTGHSGLVPPSGGINLYIGNNENYAHTINIRPGQEWAKLVAEPIKAGRDPNPWAGDPFFRDRALAFARNHPGRAIGLLFEKSLTLLSSREIPRNLDIYLHREWSPVLSLLTWRAGGWGYPFGLLFPLAMVGVFFARSREADLVELFAAGLGVFTVVVIVSARYKVLLIPLLAVLAALGILEIARFIKDQDHRRLVFTSVLMVACVVISTIPGPFAPEKVDLRAEYYFGIGHDLYDQEEWAGAADYMAKSIALDPDVHRSRQVMGIASAKLHRDDDAVLHFREAVRLRPGHRATEANLATALRERAQKAFSAAMEIEQDRPAAAVELYRKAAGDQPGWYEPCAREALVLATTQVDSLRDGPRAVDLAQRAIQLRRENDPWLTYILVCALAECGRFDEALEVAQEVKEALTGGEDVEMLSRFERAIAQIEAGEAVEVGEVMGVR
jgi:tetratricopeptide (TPR) repeat protein